MTYDKYPKDFQKFAELVNNKLKSNKLKHKDQEKHVNDVNRLEQLFKKQLMKQAPDKLEGIYLKFIHYIKHEVGNILSSQSYFREKKNVFKKISKNIQNNEVKELMKFQANFNLIQFIKDNWGSDLPELPKKTYDRFVAKRAMLIENNIPLAINRALLFYRKTTETTLSLMDLINICILGLVVGIDKYCGPYTKVWRSVCIGRMMGYLIKEYSDTFIKLFPSDRKILYRANILRYREKIDDIADLTKALNESFKNDKKNGMSAPSKLISKEYIEQLFNSAHYYSADSSAQTEETEDDEGSNFYKYDHTDYETSFTISEEIERADMSQQLRHSLNELDIISRKVIRMKGGV